jgi:hypothetical protein
MVSLVLPLAVAAARRGVRHDALDLLRHHADIRGMVASLAAEAVDADAVGEASELRDVLPEADASVMMATAATRMAAAEVAAAEMATAEVSDKRTPTTPIMPAKSTAPAQTDARAVAAPIPTRPIPAVVIPAVIATRPDELHVFDHV